MTPINLLMLTLVIFAIFPFVTYRIFKMRLSYINWIKITDKDRSYINVWVIYIAVLFLLIVSSIYLLDFVDLTYQQRKLITLTGIQTAIYSFISMSLSSIVYKRDHIK